MSELCSCENCELRDLFFKNVTNKEIQWLCTSRIEREYHKGDYLIREGEDIREFIYLKSGLVKLYTETGEKKEQIITIAKPFDFVSILSIFSNTKYHYSVKALEESVTCNLDIEEVKKLIRENGMFSMSILEKMSKVSDKIILESLEIRKRRLHGRVAYILLYFADIIYQNHEFELPISRKEIAEYIGMTTENIIRALTEFRKDKVIKIFGKGIEIVNYNKLKEISLRG